MYEEYQNEIPHSFMALFVDPGRSKPNASRDVVASRYELCEDMAIRIRVIRGPSSTIFSVFSSLALSMLFRRVRGSSGGNSGLCFSIP